jgi:hypothetical protein
MASNGDAPGARNADLRQASSLRQGEPQHQPSNYTQESTYSQPTDAAVPPPMPQGGVQYVQPGPTTLSNPDFLSRVEAVKADVRTLTTHVGQIASLHQRSLSSTDTTSSSQLESMITQTQVLNTSIKDQIKFLETDAARSKDNQVKNTQVNQLKSSFTKQLQEYRVEEANYEKRYREQIARQYRIVNPDATDAEVEEATQADWGNEGVFRTAVSIPAALVAKVDQLTDVIPAQNQPLRHGQHRPRRRARPPQRHPQDRKDAHGTEPAHGRSRHDRDPAGRADPGRRGRDGEREAGRRGRKCAVGQGHRVCATGAEAEVVVLLHVSGDCHYPRVGFGVVLWVAESE